MKKTLIALALAALSLSATAATFWHNGVLMGTICRSGPFFTPYPLHMAQPVGTTCPLRDNNGAIVGFGLVSNE